MEEQVKANYTSQLSESSAEGLRKISEGAAAASPQQAMHRDLAVPGRDLEKHEEADSIPSATEIPGSEERLSQSKSDPHQAEPDSLDMHGGIGHGQGSAAGQPGRDAMVIASAEQDVHKSAERESRPARTASAMIPEGVLGNQTSHAADSPKQNSNLNMQREPAALKASSSDVQEEAAAGAAQTGSAQGVHAGHDSSIPALLSQIADQLIDRAINAAPADTPANNDEKVPNTDEGCFTPGGYSDGDTPESFCCDTTVAKPPLALFLSLKKALLWDLLNQIEGENHARLECFLSAIGEQAVKKCQEMPSSGDNEMRQGGIKPQDLTDIAKASQVTATNREKLNVCFKKESQLRGAVKKLNACLAREQQPAEAQQSLSEIEAVATRLLTLAQYKAWQAISKAEKYLEPAKKALHNASLCSREAKERAERNEKIAQTNSTEGAGAQASRQTAQEHVQHLAGAFALSEGAGGQAGRQTAQEAAAQAASADALSEGAGGQAKISEEIAQPSSSEGAGSRASRQVSQEPAAQPVSADSVSDDALRQARKQAKKARQRALKAQAAASTLEAQQQGALEVATHAEVTDAAQQLTAEPPAHAMKAALAEAKAGSATSKSSADMENGQSSQAPQGSGLDSPAPQPEQRNGADTADDPGELEGDWIPARSSRRQAGRRNLQGLPAGSHPGSVGGRSPVRSPRPPQNPRGKAQRSTEGSQRQQQLLAKKMGKCPATKMRADARSRHTQQAAAQHAQHGSQAQRLAQQRGASGLASLQLAELASHLDRISKEPSEDCAASSRLKEHADDDYGMDDDEDCCVICLDNPREIVFLHCGHMCTCGACAEDVMSSPEAACPICRSRIATALVAMF